MVLQFSVIPFEEDPDAGVALGSHFSLDGDRPAQIEVKVDVRHSVRTDLDFRVKPFRQEFSRAQAGFALGTGCAAVAGMFPPLLAQENGVSDEMAGNQQVMGYDGVRFDKTDGSIGSFESIFSALAPVTVIPQ